MQTVVGWVKSHKLSFVLIVVLVYVLFKQIRTPLYMTAQQNFGVSEYSRTAVTAPALDSMIGSLPSTGGGDYKAVSSASNRMVVAESYLSLVVDKVDEVHRQILKKVNEVGGFMVNSSVNNPQENANASVTVRIPSTQLDETLKYFKSLSVKVATENLTGDDVTNQYSDITAKLDTLRQTKAIFEGMLLKATDIQDILNVQQQIMSIQDQIDSLKGQEKYLKETSSMAKITVYLSTDELSLPYAPLDLWRPEQVFKEAVRSVIVTLRQVLTSLIWVGVYAIFWLPALVVAFFIWRWFGQKTP
jgi:hypothetical protein